MHIALRDARFIAHLEGLTLTLATPDAENQGNLDLGQVHEVLGNVDCARRQFAAEGSIVSATVRLCGNINRVRA